MKTWHTIGSILVLLIGAGLFFIQADRLTLSLPPTGGAEYTLPLNSQSTYIIKFLANRASMTRVGLYLTTSTKNLPHEQITLNAYREDNTLLGSAVLPTSLLNNELPSQWQFASPLANVSGENILLELHMPDKLDGLIHLKTRALDGTFKYSDVLLVTKMVPPNTPLPPLDQIVVVTNPEPAAYEVYSQHHPPLAMQIGGLLIIIGLATLLPRLANTTVREIQLLGICFLLSIVACIPAIALGGIPYLLILTQTCALYGTYAYLKATSHSPLASGIGASIFAYTSWFALHLGAGRTIYALAAILPLVFLYISRTRISRMQRTISLLLLVGVLIVALLGFTASYSLPPTTSSAALRDIFLDPNQTPYATKTSDANLTWDHFGAYVGLIPAALVIIGIIKRRQPWLPPILLLASLTLVATVPMAAHAAIIPVFLLAFFAAGATDRLRLFLGADDRLIHFLLAAVGIIILLDLWQVLTPILEYPLL